MAKPAKRKVPAGRVAPKGTTASRRVTPKATAEGNRPSASTRYTPPVPRADRPSPIWVPILMFSLFGVGILSIFLNYLGLLPGATSNVYLGLGLGCICGGIVTATQYR